MTPVDIPRVARVPLMAALLCLAPPTAAWAQDAPDARQTVAVMGTLATVQLWAESRAEARDAAAAVVNELQRTENLLSSWRPDTEVGRLNAAEVGRPVPVSAELMSLLETAVHWSAWSGGAFEPVVGALVDSWDLRGTGRVPSSAERAQAVEAVGAGGMAFDVAAGTVTRLNAAAWLDAGGFGKGAALRNVADILIRRGIRQARIDLGGQLLVLGGAPVVVGVAHPAHRDSVAATLALSEVSVATSGQSERFVEVDGQRLGHILDPRTGEPVRPWGSVTVVAADPLVADILATAFLVEGPDRGMELAAGLENVGVLFLDDSGDVLRVRHNEAMEPFLRSVPGVGPAAR